MTPRVSVEAADLVIAAEALRECAKGDKDSMEWELANRFVRIAAGAPPKDTNNTDDAKTLTLARELDWRLQRTRPAQRLSTMQISLQRAIEHGRDPTY